MAKQASLIHASYPLVSKNEANAIAWSFEGPNSEAVEYPFTFPPLRADEVRIQQTYFGLCYTDCNNKSIVNLNIILFIINVGHLVNQDWFPIKYPLVPGHEILGKVVARGDAVTGFKIGDVVGVGFIRDSCGECRFCHQGNDQLCNQTGDNHVIPFPNFGGFATHVQVPSKWAFPIPSTIPQELAPPLLCAGITVYAPLKRYYKPGLKLGVIGIGGLGHLAIKFGAALGYNTFAISTSPDKEQEARSYGATGFINQRDQQQLRLSQKGFDIILNCSHAGNTQEFISQVSLIKNGGKFIMVGIPNTTATQLSLPFFQLIAGQIELIGSLVGSRQENYEMLEFAAKHKIYPTCEQFDFENFHEAYNHLLNGRPKYRCVVKVGESGNGFKQ